MSTMRKKAKEKDDFPLPVLPQIPTWKHITVRGLTPLPLPLPLSHTGPEASSYLLSRADVRVDISEHRLQRGVVTDAQILDLDLPLLRPAIRHLRGS